jgi:low affinity Fe/Cu permease
MTTDHVLFSALGGVLAVVVAVVLLALTTATWALVFALAVAAAGTAMVAVVINAQLTDADGAEHDDTEPTGR